MGDEVVTPVQNRTPVRDIRDQIRDGQDCSASQSSKGERTIGKDRIAAYDPRGAQGRGASQGTEKAGPISATNKYE